MTQDKDLLSFTLNESLLVEGMQGIEEMLAISLDPDIAIETFHEDIRIRGIIILQGEYKKVLDEQNKSEHEPFSSLQIIEKMIETEENQVMFSHRFPVEVTVAKNRINDLNDVKVEVVAFDYEIPANNRLNISAELHIHGILNERNIPDHNQEIEDVKDTPEKLQEDSGMKPDKKEDVKTHEKEVFHQEEKVVEESTLSDSEKVSNKIDHERPDEGEVNYNINMNEQEEEDDIDIQLNETEDEEVVEDVLFLTDIFADTDEKSVSTMRIHIIQKEDTIESVAKRYDMSALQLMKDNQLNADEMTPGKLIYIQNQNIKK